MVPFEPKIIRNIKIAWKLRLTALGFLLPFAILLYLLISEKNIAIDFAEKELRGSVYLQPLGELYRYMWQYDREAIYGNPSPEKSQILSDKVSEAFRRLDEYDRKYPSYRSISNDISEISSSRAEFMQNFSETPLEENASRSLDLLQKVRFIMLDVGDHSNLILDPRLDSYYLMNAVLIRIPEETFQIYQIVHYYDLTYNDRKISQDEFSRVVELNGLLKSNIMKVSGIVKSAFERNAGGYLENSLGEKLSDAVNKSKNFTQILDAAIKTKTVPDKAFFESSAIQSIDANFRLWKTSSEELDNLIRGRAAELNYRKFAALVVVGVLIMLTTLLFIFISGNITRSVEQLNEAANRVAVGDLDVTVGINANDELGNLGRNFNKMVAELRSFIKEKTELFEETEKELTNRIYLHEKQEEATSQQLRNLSSRLQSIREEERTMIAREIHDELGQVLTVLKIQISLLANKLRDDQDDLKEKIEQASGVIDKTVESVQRISSKLRPGILDNLGLIPAIEWQAQDFQERTGIKCDLSLPKEEISMDDEKSTAIFRIFQEALTNVARHAKASLITVYLGVSAENLVLEFTDNGMGITEEQIRDPKSLGLLGMKERAFILGGSVVINGEPGRGTSVKVLMPMLGGTETMNSETGGALTA
ncbi:MAG: sensor histidine kinase [Ignavibacteria bacterium]|jgi:signal transduction histidine kinase|nr:sensor histidine kinase [Ignavibacteria bacterium]MCU7505210.1 sensor histidine kinase [Ignavibacteria bacterium]MCU7517296.1 sensor histidine kinase [Ignavibacteria bacterium]